jgi:hypothetical protein
MEDHVSVGFARFRTVPAFKGAAKHEDRWNCFVVRADEKLTAFLELEVAMRTTTG